MATFLSRVLCFITILIPPEHLAISAFIMPFERTGIDTKNIGASLHVKTTFRLPFEKQG